MKKPIRITIALDEETAELLEKIKEGVGHSQSEIIRQALKYYSANKNLIDLSSKKRIHRYLGRLLSGEHVILDVNHWILLLNLIESSPEKEKFWRDCRDVARSDAEQLKPRVSSAEDLLECLEACNFFRMNKNSKNDFTLVLGSEISRNFIKVFLEEFFSAMDIRAEITENFAKIRVIAKDEALICAHNAVNG